MGFGSLATLFGLGFLSGLNLYAVVFVSGLAIRMQWIHLTPQLASLEILTRPSIMITAGVLYLVEFVADKIPWVDNVWDAVHTVVRPLAATFLSIYALGDQSTEVKIIAALICGTFAFASHAAKAGTRLSTNVLSPAEPFSNIGLSLAEDAIVVGGLYFVYKHPYIALALVIACILLIAWFTPKLIRVIRSFLQRRKAVA